MKLNPVTITSHVQFGVPPNSIDQLWERSKNIGMVKYYVLDKKTGWLYLRLRINHERIFSSP